VGSGRGKGFGHGSAEFAGAADDDRRLSAEIKETGWLHAGSQGIRAGCAQTRNGVESVRQKKCCQAGAVRAICVTSFL
jgi:hypothetical protein